MRKSELGNLVAANMADIMDSEEHRQLFYKQAAETCTCDCEKCQEKGKHTTDECSCGKKEDKADADDSKKCECGKEPCECEKDESDADDAEVFAKLFESVLKLSEQLDEMGFAKSAAGFITVADTLLAEAAGADTIEEMLRENPDLDVDVAVVKEKPGAEEEAAEGELLDPRMTSLEFEGEDDGDLEAQLNAIEEAGLGGKQEGPLSEDEKGKMHELGLSELEAANAAVDAWLAKNSSDNSNDIDTDLDLSNLLVTAEKEVEDYLIEKGLSFEDES